MVREFGFNSFMEVSAKENFGVEELFERAITLVRSLPQNVLTDVTLKINVYLQALEYHSLNQGNKNVVMLSGTAPPPQRKCSC